MGSSEAWKRPALEAWGGLLRRAGKEGIPREGRQCHCRQRSSGQELQQPGHTSWVAEDGQDTHHEADVLDLADAHVDALPVVDGQADVDEVVLVCHAADLHEGQEVAVVVTALGLHSLQKGQGAEPRPSAPRDQHTTEPSNWEHWEHPGPVCKLQPVQDSG